MTPPGLSTPPAVTSSSPQPEPTAMGGGGSTATAGAGAMGGGGTGTAAGGAAGAAGGDSMEGGSAGLGDPGVPPVTMSEGCGKANPQLGSSQSPLSVSNHQYYVKLPTSYDENNAYPVMFMFHPTNNPLNWAEQNAGFESTEAKDLWIRVYPGAGNNASGWGSSDVSFFEPLYDTITNEFCVDTERVFASGESSGGDFSSILGCEFAQLIRSTAPCATKPVGG
jgi:hypothetical protein